MNTNTKEQIGWIDLLRVIACFLVVVAHSCDAFVAQLDTDPSAFLTGTLTGSLVRNCVPLFTMMSGVLLLPVMMSMTDFYKKRIKRIVIPLVFWSIVLPFTYYFYLNYGYQSTSPLIDMDNFTLSATLKRLYTFLFNFNHTTTPLWYLYMLVGLYMVMPIISVWLKQATQKEVKTVLYIWGVTLFLPYIKLFATIFGLTGSGGNMMVLGVCDWNEFGMFYYFSGFLGYLILAYYLVKYPVSWSMKKALAICIPMFIVGYLITAFGFLAIQDHFPGNYTYLEAVWYFCGINVFMMTFPVFVIVQKMKIKSSARMSRIAGFTFGIYLCHFIIVQMANDLFASFTSLPYIVQLLGVAVVSFFVSYLVTWIMAQWKVTRRFIA